MERLQNKIAKIVNVHDDSDLDLAEGSVSEWKEAGILEMEHDSDGNDISDSNTNLVKFHIILVSY